MCFFFGCTRIVPPLRFWSAAANTSSNIFHKLCKQTDSATCEKNHDGQVHVQRADQAHLPLFWHAVARSGIENKSMYWVYAKDGLLTIEKSNWTGSKYSTVCSYSCDAVTCCIVSEVVSMCQAEVLVASHQESYTNSLSGQKPAIVFQFLDVDTEGTGSSRYINATQQSTRTSSNKREIHLALLSFCKRAGSWLLSEFCSMLWWVLYSFAILSNIVCRSAVTNTDAIRDCCLYVQRGGVASGKVLEKLQAAGHVCASEIVCAVISHEVSLS